jgi:hypothetical protein
VTTANISDNPPRSRVDPADDSGSIDRIGRDAGTFERALGLSDVKPSVESEVRRIARVEQEPRVDGSCYLC